MPRGMSKCRRCGKSVPSIYRPYHEQVACLELKREKGLLLHRVLPRVPKPVVKDPLNHKLMEWHPKKDGA